MTQSPCSSPQFYTNQQWLLHTEQLQTRGWGSSEEKDERTHVENTKWPLSSFWLQSSATLLFYFFSWLTFSFSPSVSMVLFVFLIYGEDEVRYLTVWHALLFLRKGISFCLSRYLQFRREYWAILPEPWSFSLSAREPYPKWMKRRGRHFLCYEFL